MKPMTENQKGELRKVISTGMDSVASGASALAGSFLAGPFGAIIGGAIGPFLGKAFGNIGDELSERLLGPREKHRISKVIEYAVEKLEEKHRNGVLLRGEEFFKQDMLGRSPAEELLEGTLVIGQRSYEEKKLKFLGNL